MNQYNLSQSEDAAINPAASVWHRSHSNHYSPTWSPQPSWNPPMPSQKPTKSGAVPPPADQGWRYKQQNHARFNIYEHLNREAEFQEEASLSDNIEPSETRPFIKKNMKALHVYDFDNTLFSSPVPNPCLFNESSRLLLNMEDGINGSCWQREPSFLQLLGMGLEKERQRGWKWFWNEDVVKLARMSIADGDVMAVVVSEREEDLFSKLIQDILQSKGLKFDSFLIKSKSAESESFKADSIGDLLDSLPQLNEVTVYDNDHHQMSSIRQVVNERDINFQGVLVMTKTSHLNPLVERDLVEELVEQHNNMVREKKHSHLNQLAVRKSIFQTAYLVEMESRRTLIDHCINNQADFLPVDEPDTLARLKFCCETIPITFNQISKGEMTRLGGLGCPVLFGTAYCGCIPGKLYAVKLLCNKEEVKTATGEEPILIVAVGPNEEGSYEYKYDDVKQITDWHIADEMIDVRCQIGYKQILKIQPILRKNVEHTGQREVQE